MHLRECPWMASSFCMPSFGLWKYLPELQGAAVSKCFNRYLPPWRWFCSWEAVESPVSPRVSLQTSSNSFPLNVASQPALTLPFSRMNGRPPSGVQCQQMKKISQNSNSNWYFFLSPRIMPISNVIYSFRFKITCRFCVDLHRKPDRHFKSNITITLKWYVALLFIWEARFMKHWSMLKAGLWKKKTIRTIYSGGSENIHRVGTSIEFIKAAG